MNETQQLMILLETAARCILKKKEESGFLSIKEFAKYCSRHKFKWPQNHHRARLIEPMIKALTDNPVILNNAIVEITTSPLKINIKARCKTNPSN